MKIYQYRPVILVLMLAAVLMVGIPSWALAQCGGGGSGSMGSMHDQHMGSSSQMGSGQMGMYGNQSPVQPGYAAPAPPAPGYAAPQNPGGYGSGQMMNQGGTGSGHQGHTGH